MGRTDSFAPGYALDDEFDPRIDDFVSKDRPYLHFDLPIPESERSSFSLTTSDILSNSFWPLIGYVSEERRIKKDKAGNVSFTKKERPIKFGSHRDAALLEYYAKSLSIDYESLLISHGTQEIPIAYRSGIGNNITHSKLLFDEIRRRGDCIAIALDISGFFDNINHGVLKAALQKARSVSRLSDADYAVFRRLTNYEWVDADALKSRLGGKMGRGGRICTARDFRKFVRDKNPNLININQEEYGIPQGTPISGLYANLSMTKIDREIKFFIDKIGGYFRRYSEDIAIVVNKNIDPNEVIEFISDRLSLIGLSLGSHKTEISQFSKGHGVLSADRPFQYLGFTFDGAVTLVRNSSLNRFYSKMHDGVRSKVLAAKRNGINKDEIYLRELFKNFTHFGRSRNFPRYVYRAADVHNSIEMRGQIRNHVEIFKRVLKSAINEVY